MLDRTPVPQSVARKLQSMILNGDLKKGDKIPPQRELAERLGVSRPSLREALLSLESIGLIRTQPGSGTFVTGQNPSSSNNMAPWRYSDSFTVHEVFQTRLMLEGRIARLAAERLTQDDFRSLADSTDRMERFWESNDLLANVEADLEFHATITRACGNRMLIALYKTVQDQITETQRQPIPITDPRRMRSSIAEHRTLIHELRRGDGAAAGMAMETHIRNTARCAGIEV